MGRKRTVAALALAGLAVFAAVALAESLRGTAGPDTIDGTQRGDRITGFGGNDALSGRGGRDRVRGGRGDDRVSGGPAQDKLRGGSGSDRLRAGAGNDKLFGGRGRDEFNTRNGVLLGSPGNDVIRARDFTADEIDCDEGWDKVYVDGIEDGVYNCEQVIAPDGEIGEHVAPEPEEGE